MQLSCILRLLVRYSHHAPNPGVSGIISAQLADQLFGIHPIRLCSLISPIDFNRCGVDHDVLDPAFDQCAMEPKTFSADFIAADDSYPFLQTKPMSCSLEFSIQSLPVLRVNRYRSRSSALSVTETELPFFPAQLECDI